MTILAFYLGAAVFNGTMAAAMQADDGYRDIPRVIIAAVTWPYTLFTMWR
jgi:hypothetical protein